jgi:hypothetical protein
VSIPKATIWQKLRQDCLDAIPSASRVSQTAPVTLASWQSSGYYTVVSTTQRRFALITSSVDFGSALLTDAECFLDHAAEHQVSLWKQIGSRDWVSPAWLGVTIYYWAFYVSLALTRLTGRTAWFLTKDVARNLRKLGPSSPSAPGAGCFRLICGANVSATDRNLMLEKTTSRIHEEVWRIWFGYCASQLARLSIVRDYSPEDRLYSAIVRSAKFLGDDWPTAFRNIVNYRPGFAYTAVRRQPVLKSLGYLKTPVTYDFETLLDRFETNLSTLRIPGAFCHNPQAVMELLVDLTFIIHAIVTELHCDLVLRHGLDGRWRQSRQHFLCLNGLQSKDGIWPA